MKAIRIGPHSVGEGHRPLVIAEAGINHNGDRTLGLSLVRAAKEAGADMVKFQTHIAAAEMLPDRGPAGEAGSHVTGSLYDIMSNCHLTVDDHLALKVAAEELGLLFLSTPFSVEAVDMLEEVGMPAYKVGSGEVTNLPFLDYVAGKGKPVILSTGTGRWEEIERAVATVRERNDSLILMQCTSNYPTAYENVNFGVIDRMREAFDLPVGLSDHCAGNYACFGAVARGACLLEKHFTLSRRLPGIDQSSSIEPDELRDLVAGVAAVAAAAGSEKSLNDEALKVRRGFSESVVTVASVMSGEVFVPRVNVWVKRPGNGIPSYRLGDIAGKRAARDVTADVLLEPSDIEDFIS